VITIATDGAPDLALREGQVLELVTIERHEPVEKNYVPGLRKARLRRRSQAALTSGCAARAQAEAAQPEVAGGLRVDEDLDVVLVVVDELVEALLDEVLERDTAGDERREVELAGPDESDGRDVVVGVGDRAA
jgi:hypothetical protein